MDYKEKYNTIIERAKTAYNGTCKYKGKDLIEYLLNGVEEINENEDERIRKAIINVFATHKDYEIFFGVSVEDIIAYLEKQKGLNFDAISSWLRDHANNYVNGEFNEFHHCVEYDGTIDAERLIADLKVAVDGGAFDVDAAFDTREPRDNWEYIKEFCDKFGRMPKDIDELDALVSYVMDKKQKEQKPTEWSEDERIRKALWEYFHDLQLSSDCDFSPSLTIDDVLAYLEKQKEQKLATLDESIELGLDRALCIVKSAKGNLPAYQTDDGIYECDSAIRTLENLLKNGIEQKPTENISQLTVQGKGVYKICPRCKERMVRDDSKIYTSIPPKYGYECPKCGEMEFDTVMYDSPEMEEQKHIEGVIKNITKNKEAATNFLKSAGIMDDNGELAEMYRSEQQPAEIDEYKIIEKHITEDSLSSEVNKRLKDCGWYVTDEKPEEWSEEDEKMRIGLISVIREIKMQPLKRLEDWDGYIHFLESIHPQPKQEWGDGEKKVLDSIIDDYKKANKSFCGYAGKIVLLNAIRNGEYDLSKHVWGDEDEKTIDEAVECIEKYAEYVQGGFSKLHVLDLARRVDSLRPQSHWKPSEEQVKAIDLAIRFVTDDFDEHPTLSETLRGLYNDLKKL